MPISIPKFFQKAFAQNGGKQDVPVTGDTSGGRASYDVGFPPVTRIPIVAGGIPPFGTDFNGVLYDITSAIQYIQAGLSFPYNQDFADAIGGYGKGSLVSLESDLSVVYKSKVDNNLTSPPSANWEIAGFIVQATELVAGVAKIATPSLAQGFINDTDFLTSKKLADAFKGSNISTSVNGFQRLPGGLILQWGSQTNEEIGSGVITFPIAFPTSCFACTGCVSAGSTGHTLKITPTNTQFNWNILNLIGVSVGAFQWFAIGY
jgi:hypothetical protein